MSDVTPTAPVSTEASPAPAGNPGTPPATPATPPPAPVAPEVKATNATHARLRIAEKALKQQASSAPPPPPPNDIDPVEKETIEKVVDAKYGHLDSELSNLRSEADEKEIQQEVNTELGATKYKDYLTDAEKDQVHKLARDPAYAHIPVDQLITLAIAGRITEIGAEMAKKASAKIADTRLPTPGSSMGTPPKSPLEMSDKEWEQERKNLGFSS